MSEVWSCCFICNKEFDTFNHVPLLLPCDHTVCQYCLNNSFSIYGLNVCPFERCGKISNSLPRYLRENQFIMGLRLRKETKLKEVQNAVELVQKQKKMKKRLVGELTKKYNELINLILKKANYRIFSNTMEIMKALEKDNGRDKEKLKSLSLMAELLQDQDNLNIDLQLEQIINEEHVEFRENQVKNEIERLGLIHQQMENFLGTTFENLMMLRNQQVQSISNIQAQQQIQQQRYEEAKISMQQQKPKHSFVNLFQTGSKSLHTFDIMNETYKIIEIQIEIPVWSRSTQYQEFWYLVGGEIKGKVTENTWKVDKQGNSTQFPSLQCARDSFGLSVAKGIMIAAGGFDGKQSLRVVEMLDLANPTN